MTPPERGGGYEYKPDFEENPSIEVPPNPPARSDYEKGDFVPEDPDESYEEGDYYDSDDDSSGGFKVVHLGCGALILVSLVLAIVVPVCRSFGGGGSDRANGSTACNLLLEIVLEFPDVVPIDAEFIGRAEEIEDVVENAEAPIRESSQALSNAARGLVNALTDVEAKGFAQEINAQWYNLGQACVDAGYLTRL